MFFLAIELGLKVQLTLPLLQFIYLVSSRGTLEIMQFPVLQNDGLLDHLGKKLLIMRDEDERAFFRGEEMLKPDNSLKIL